jgi:NAD(P)-dependent dehydrogenase (short-subunit alcohol dehydrogenase family)
VEDLNNRSAVLTGAGGGIGRSIALTLAREGVNVAIADIDGQAAGDVAEEARAYGVRALGVTTDVSDLEEVKELADSAYAAFGTVDILVNNAGVAMRPHRASWDTSYSDFKWMMDVNYWGVLHGFMAFVPRMLKTGRDKHIVNTSSMATLTPFAGNSAYSASKAAVEAFSLAARAEFIAAKIPIGVSILLPGAVKTRITTSDRLRPDEDKSAHRSVVAWDTYVTPDEDVASPDLEFATELARMAQYRKSTQEPATELSGITHFLQSIVPDLVGPMVLDAIRANRQFVLTHPAPSAIQDRCDELANSFKMAQSTESWRDSAAGHEEPVPSQED